MRLLKKNLTVDYNLIRFALIPWFYLEKGVIFGSSV
jgi:hypothetical protein